MKIYDQYDDLKFDLVQPWKKKIDKEATKSFLYVCVCVCKTSKYFLGKLILLPLGTNYAMR